MVRLDYLWRQGGTGLAFAVIFFGGGVLAATVLPLLAMIPGDQQKRSRWVVGTTFRFYLGMLQFLGLIHLQIEGAEKLREPGGRLVIANHPSLLDVVMLMAVLPRQQCIVKHELWNHRFLGPLMRRAGYIRNDLDPEQLVDACQKSLALGDSLIIFPEGTRSQPGKSPQFRRGIANLATLTGAPIQLVVITCDPPTLIKGEPWWRVPSRRPRFRLMTGDCLDAATYRKHPHRSIAARRLTRRLEQYYEEKLGYV